jgi:membrane fusion protein, multidrug efflux system
MNQLTSPAELKIERQLQSLDTSHSIVATGDVTGHVGNKRRPGWLRLAAAGAAAIGIVLGLSSFGWHYWTIGRFEVSTDDAYVKADSTIVAPKVGGYLREVLVADNQPVKAGRLLAKIDDRDFVTAVQQARANVAAAQADIDNINATIEQQQAVIAQARATLTVDKANLTFMEQDNDRYAVLADRGAGSVQMAQQAISKRDISRATVTRDAAAIDAAEKQSNMLRAQLAKAQAALLRDRALLEQAELNLGYTNVIAPVDGVVGNRSLRVGQFVQAGTQLMAVVPLDDVYVVANFKETQLTDVRAGQPVEVAIDTFPDARIKGHIDSIAPASGQEFALLPPDNATGNFTKIVQRIPVRIVLDRDDPVASQLRPGMSVVPTINTKQPARATADRQIAASK